MSGQTGCAGPATNGSPPCPNGDKPSVDGPGSIPGKAALRLWCRFTRSVRAVETVSVRFHQSVPVRRLARARRFARARQPIPIRSSPWRCDASPKGNVTYVEIGRCERPLIPVLRDRLPDLRRLSWSGRSRRRQRSRDELQSSRRGVAPTGQRQQQGRSKAAVHKPRASAREVAGGPVRCGSTGHGLPPPNPILAVCSLPTARSALTSELGNRVNHGEQIAEANLARVRSFSDPVLSGAPGCLAPALAG
jgi:hypothetical protein